MCLKPRQQARLDSGFLVHAVGLSDAFLGFDTVIVGQRDVGVFALARFKAALGSVELDRDAALRGLLAPAPEPIGVKLQLHRTRINALPRPGNTLQ